MGVTIDGIKGYEYQYKVTVLIALMNLNSENELYVESVGMEDAFLKLIIDGNIRGVEVQVKREANLIDVSKLCNWLSHFREFSSDSNLLQECIEDENRIALFATRSRCSDSILPFKSKISQLSENVDSLYTKTLKKEILSTLFSQPFGTSELKRNREAFCKQQSDRLSKDGIPENLFQRILIWEELEEDLLDDKIRSLLNSAFKISISNSVKTYLLILESVRKGRDDGEDVLPLIQKVIEDNAIRSPKLDQDYISSPFEESLTKETEEKSLILLSGNSLCGKTQIAKKIATHYFNKGYDYKLTDDVDEINRFLSSNIEDQKIVILEDPFGHLNPHENSNNLVRKIEGIISNKENHHILIITSRKDILLRVFDCLNLEGCKLFDYTWKDTTLNSNEFAIQLWEKLTKTRLPLGIVEVVSKGLEESQEKHLLQIGQLVYLSKNEIKNLEGKSFNELEHIARRDSKDIAMNVKGMGSEYELVMSVLAMASTPIVGISFSDLSYMLDDNENKLSYHDSDNASFFMEKEVKYPTYPKDLTLSDSIQNILYFFEERNFLSITDEEVLFNHPDYYEAGRQLFISTSRSKQINKINLLLKCTSSLSTENSLVATKNFSFVFNNIRASLRSNLLEMAFNILKTIYPSVEDEILLFLTGQLEAITKNQVQKLLNRIQGGTRSYNVNWFEKRVPFRSKISSLDSVFTEIDSDALNRAKKKLDSNELPNQYESWALLQNAQYKKEKISSSFLNVLLNHNEAFIREAVVYELIKQVKTIDVNYIKNIFSDDHPSVIFHCIRALLLNWKEIPGEHRIFYKKIILDSLSDKLVSIRAYNLVLTFSIDYSGDCIINWSDLSDKETKELWELWSEFYPIVVDKVPLGLYVNSGRFTATMIEGMKHLSIKNGVNVIQNWLLYINKQLKSGLFLDDHEMAIASYLIKLTKEDYKIRESIFNELITSKDTNFLLSNIKWSIDLWSNLNDLEKEQMLNVIDSKRIDNRWIISTFLASERPPKEFLQKMYNDTQILDKNVEEIISIIPRETISDAIGVFLGKPGQFSSLGLSHQNAKLWVKVIHYILINNKDIQYDLCLDEFVADGVNGFSTFSENGIEIWKSICSKSENLERLTLSLIENVVRSSCVIQVTKEMWDILIKAFEDSNLINKLLELLKSKIELILHPYNKDFIRVIEREFLLKKLIPILPKELNKDKISKIGGIEHDKILDKMYDGTIENWQFLKDFD